MHDWYAVASSSDGTKLVAVVGNFGYIYTSTDSGATWTEQTDSGTRNWYGVASSSDGTKLVAVDNSPGYIYTSTDSGATWTERTTSGQRDWYGVASSSDGTKLVAVNNNGYIYTSVNSGANWTERTTSGSRVWKAVASSSDGTKLVAVDNGGYIYTSVNSGANWTERTTSGSRDWYAVASSSDGTKLVAVVYAGYIYTSANSGANWTQSTTSGQREWNGVASSSDGTKLVATVDNPGYIYTVLNTIAWTLQLNIIGPTGPGLETTGFISTVNALSELGYLSTVTSLTAINGQGPNISITPSGLSSGKLTINVSTVVFADSYLSNTTQHTSAIPFTNLNFTISPLQSTISINSGQANPYGVPLSNNCYYIVSANGYIVLDSEYGSNSYSDISGDAVFLSIGASSFDPTDPTPGKNLVASPIMTGQMRYSGIINIPWSFSGMYQSTASPEYLTLQVYYKHAFDTNDNLYLNYLTAQFVTLITTTAP